MKSHYEIYLLMQDQRGLDEFWFMVGMFIIVLLFFFGMFGRVHDLVSAAVPGWARRRLGVYRAQRQRRDSDHA